MLIQPIEPVVITIKIGQNNFECQMISLSESELELKVMIILKKKVRLLLLQNIFEAMPSFVNWSSQITALLTKWKSFVFNFNRACLSTPGCNIG